MHTPKKPIYLLFSFVFLILKPVPSKAAGFFIAPHDAQAAAKGNAYTATANSPSAIYYNPAGISQLDSPSITLGSYNIQLGNKVRIGDDIFSVKSEWQAVPHIYFVTPIDDRIHFGLGANSPYGLGIDWGDVTPFRNLSTRAETLYSTLWSVFSYKITNSLSLGGGLSLSYANFDLRQGIVTQGDEFRFEGDDLSIGWVLAARWEPNPHHAFGAVYRSHNSFDLEGDATTSIPGNQLFLSESAKLDLISPEIISFGYSYRPNANWNIELGFDWIGWDRLNTSTLSKNSGNIDLPFNWQSTFIYNAGLTYHLNDTYSFSLGYNYNANAVSDETFSPLIPDSDTHYLNIGLTKNYTNWSWSTAYQYGFSSRNLDLAPDAPNSAASGNYETSNHAFIFSASYKF